MIDYTKAFFYVTIMSVIYKAPDVLAAHYRVGSRQEIKDNLTITRAYGQQRSLILISLNSRLTEASAECNCAKTFT